ncbi:MAG: mechanosensitive ion channel [Oscillatoria sp. SIO1A7]|nr:mechanosensitive ion channel [Oscillatoria sp. SIO1A7]
MIRPASKHYKFPLSRFWAARPLAGFIIMLMLGLLLTLWGESLVLPGQSGPLTKGAIARAVTSPAAEELSPRGTEDTENLESPIILSAGQLSKKQSEAIGNWFNNQAQKAKAPMTLDGRELFLVNPVPGYPAEVRASSINEQLKEATELAEPINVEVKLDKTNKLPTIVLNEDKHLLTVTQRDTPENLPAQEQAEIWAIAVQDALEQAQEERSAEFIESRLSYTAIILVVALVLHAGMGQLLDRYRSRFNQILASYNVEHEWIDWLLDLILTVARVALWVGAAFYIANLFPVSREWSYRILNAILAIFVSPVFNIGPESYSVASLLFLAGLFCGLVVIAGKLTQLLNSRFLQLTPINRGAREGVTTIAKYTFITVGTLVLLQAWGIDLSSITIIASALSVGIAFGFQDIAKNFASGLVLIFERPIQVGDFVEVNEYTGTVERIGSRSTTIRTLDKVSIILPNSRFLENEVINWSHQDPVSRLHIPVGVAYGCDTKVVQATLLEAAKEHPDLLKFPAPRVMFKGFGDSSLDFELLVWSRQPEKQYWIKSDLRFLIDDLLRQQEIEIPFPQRDLHVRSGKVPLELSSDLENAILQVMQKFSNGQKE